MQFNLLMWTSLYIIKAKSLQAVYIHKYIITRSDFETYHCGYINRFGVLFDATDA